LPNSEETVKPVNKERFLLKSLNKVRFLHKWVPIAGILTGINHCFTGFNVLLNRG